MSMISGCVPYNYHHCPILLIKECKINDSTLSKLPQIHNIKDGMPQHKTYLLQILADGSTTDATPTMLSIAEFDVLTLWIISTSS